MRLTASHSEFTFEEKMKASENANRDSRSAVKQASRHLDAARLAKGEDPQKLQRENSIFPVGFFENARISNLKQAVGR
ncbi:MAG: hypothetical protein ACSHX7_13995 [Luteolibacter sp.]